MNGERYQRVRELFHAACELSADERDAYLKSVCRGDVQLLAEVKSLLAGDADQTDAFAEIQLEGRRQELQQALEPGAAQSSDMPVHGRFLPGVILADRYRVVSLLGSGGMGEVYRADDLKLGQPVALKFISNELSLDVRLRRYLLNEVRLSRQIAHPNVCRVYDVGEIDGAPFLSMEYIDGEDLRSLLRRIGRIAEDKGVAIARQLCLGLAAAHDRGVVHRDLKPGNVMIDGRGQVRITDFGLARLTSDGEAPQEIAGTPAYMAPEQLARGEVSQASDLYSLGLVLYELFTGQPVRDAGAIEKTRGDVRRAPSQTALSATDQLDPALERVISACLETDPAQRPASARDVAAALPGGNSLDAAVAAGQTPSPDAVAAAEQRATLSRQGVAAILGGVLVGIVAIGWLSRMSQRAIDFRSEELNRASEARELIRSLGYDEQTADSAWGLAWDDAYFAQLRDSDDAMQQWAELTGAPPTAANYWRRQHTTDLVPQHGRGPFSALFVTPDDPPPLQPGMISAVLDTKGRLLQFLAVPSHAVPPGKADGDHSGWHRSLLTAAGINARAQQDLLQPYAAADGPLMPPVLADDWKSWETKSPGIAVQAAAYQGRPVYFRIAPIDKQQQPSKSGILQAGLVVTVLLVFATALALARRNWLTDRADRRGALRMFSLVLAASFLYWALQAHHVAGAGELVMILQTAARALLRALIICAAYIGLEPYIRRWRPRLLIGWNRLLRGQFRDPAVGRELLIGTACGALAQLIGSAGLLLGNPRQIALICDPVLRVGAGPFDLRPLMGPHAALGQVCAELFVALVGGFVACPLFFLLLRGVLRKTWIAAIAFVVFYSIASFVQGDIHGGATVALWAALGLMVFLQVGVLALAVAWFSWRLLAWPLSFNITSPSVDLGAIAYFVVMTLALYAAMCATSTSNRNVGAPMSLRQHDGW